MFFSYYRQSIQLLISGLLIAGIACTKWTTVPSPHTEVTAEGAFSNDKSAEATVAGLYSQIMTGSLYFLDGGTTLYPALSADELYNTSPDASIDPFMQNALSSRSFAIGNDLWGKGYSYLYQENACIEGLAATTSVSSRMNQQLTGEAKFMRALTLFYLVNLYGGVPLALSTDYQTNASLPRADTGAVYRQILADLWQGETLLTEAGVLSSEPRPSAMACHAFLARVYLYRQDWTGAAEQADSVITSSLYQLPAPGDVFLAGSPETIFALSPVIPGVNTAEGQAFIPYDPSVMPLYALQAPLLSSFEAGDQRLASWVNSTTIDGVTYFYPYKYKVSAADDIEENNIVLRLAELYLIRAEARAKLGELTGAAEDINVIRARAGLATIAPGLSQTEMLGRIAQENRVEFFTEWGHRWLDLKRTQTADSVLGAEKPGWRATDALYPVPYGEILLNGALVQNEGY